jgi:hypothetical protein
MFNHVQIETEIKQLERIEKNGKRLYLTPTGEKYPSITTVLSWFSAKSIAEWRRRVGEATANKISTRAATRGTDVHKLCEDYLNNVDIDYSKYVPTTLETFYPMRKVLDKHITDVYTQEASLYSHHLGLAGSVDCISKFDGKLSVIDFKTSTKSMIGDKYGKLEKYFRQAAGYSVMWEELTGIPITQLVIIAAIDDKPDPEIYVSHRDKHIEGLIEMIEEYKRNN